MPDEDTRTEIKDLQQHVADVYGAVAALGELNCELMDATAVIADAVSGHLPIEEQMRLHAPVQKLRASSAVVRRKTLALDEFLAEYKKRHGLR